MKFDHVTRHTYKIHPHLLISLPNLSAANSRSKHHRKMSTDGPLKLKKETCTCRPAGRSVGRSVGGLFV